MIYRMEIGLRSGVPDARARSVAGRARSALGIQIDACRTRDVYKLRADLDGAKADEVRRAFTDEVVAVSAMDRLPPPDSFDWLVEIGFKPGVTDNLGRTARCVLQDVAGRELAWEEQVYTASQVFCSGALSRDDMLRLGRDLLANTLIQTVQVFSRDEWLARKPDLSLPEFQDHPKMEVKTTDLSGSDEDLMRISSEGILSLSLDEMHAIRDHFSSTAVSAERVRLGLPPWPTDVELECIAQTWSEHCSHKIFAADVHFRDDETGEESVIHNLYRTYIKGSTRKIAEDANWMVSVFTDNAGVMEFDENVHLAYKVETHNSPSALDPYGGAMTGIVGVNRDPMGTGMGCQLLANVWGYCLASPFYDQAVPEGLMHPRRIRDGVHQGVIDGGNQSGIPWARGFECFDERFLGKPLVYCGTLGTLPVEVGGRPSERKEVSPGDLVVMVGGRIGKDGIHGATFSSEELRTESPAQAVQIGDPLTQRKLYDFLMEARDAGLYRCITDNGAGGISCSFGEMGKYSGGCDCELADAPLKYEGLQPWEILLSEAQERMTLAVPPEDREAFAALAKRRDVDVAFMGTFNESGRFVIRYRGDVVASLDMDFLYETGCPRMSIPARWTPPTIPCPQPEPQAQAEQELLDVLRDLNQCSREYKSRMYDGEVKGLSVLKPFTGVCADVPSDAAVMRVRYESNRGVVLAEGINPWYSDLDTYHMTTSVIDEAVRCVIAVGGRLERIAILDNFCWPDPVLSDKTPDGPYKMAQLVRANRALYDLTTAYRTPAISGKDSMKNDSTRGGRKISIPPTLLISSLGQVDDVRRVVSLTPKQVGDAVYVLGDTHAELGGSALYRLRAQRQGTPLAYGGDVPRVRIGSALELYGSMNRATDSGLLRSATTPAKGGLALSFAMMVMASRQGLEIELDAAPTEGVLDPLEVLFSESNSRFVVTCAADRAGELEALFADSTAARVGTVTDSGKLRVRANGRDLICLDATTLADTFQQTLRGI